MKKVLCALSVFALCALAALNAHAANKGPLRSSQYDVFPVLKVDYYLRANPAARESCGNDYSCANHHYYNTGIYMNYKGSPVFDVFAYIANNLDLYENLDWDRGRMVVHYMKYGVYEDRRATSYEFNPEEYMELNPDVANAHGNSDYYKAVWHYYHHGVNEGRASSDRFKVKKYIDNYSDLRRAFGNDYAAGLIHWEVHGRSEGRRKTN